MLNDFVAFGKIKEGDIKAFEQVFRRYYAPLCLYSSGITGRKEVAEEVVQDVFYNIWKERRNIRVLHSMKSYLYGAVKNLSLRYLENLSLREKHLKNLSEGGADALSGPSPQEQLEYKELEHIIDRTIKKLPERRMQIFKMHRMEGKKYKEIAGRLSISVKTVEAEMTKAYKTLRQEIEKYTVNHGF
ncbi:MAG: RNA polymerase sigma-70 factor [Tannerella sp.]|jgi:RNA polymerase sigma-70 factor (ECF subfamily)|nr:RNA polymerase sigma-70 factor [Tannerella sp.]